MSAKVIAARCVLSALAAATLLGGRAPAQAAPSPWTFRAEEGVCTVSFSDSEDQPVFGFSYYSDGSADFLLMTTPREKGEEPPEFRIITAKGEAFQDTSEVSDGDGYTIYSVAAPARKDMAVLLSGDLTFQYFDGRRAKTGGVIPVAQQLPRVTACMAAARAQARELGASAPVDRSSAPAQNDMVGATGSGFFVDRSGALVTNAHVVEGCQAMTARGYGPVTLVATDPASDLALLRTARAPRSFIQLRGDAPRLGEAVVVAGYPVRNLLENGLNVTAGNVSALAGIGGDRRFIQITAPIQPGNSGGPIIDETGRLVGVAVATLADDSLGGRAKPQNVNFAVAPFVVEAFLRENGIAYATAKDGRRQGAEAIADQARRHTVSLECTA